MYQTIDLEAQINGGSWRKVLYWELNLKVEQESQMYYHPSSRCTLFSNGVVRLYICQYMTLLLSLILDQLLEIPKVPLFPMRRLKTCDIARSRKSVIFPSQRMPPVYPETIVHFLYYIKLGVIT